MVFLTEVKSLVIIIITIICHFIIDSTLVIVDRSLDRLTYFEI